MDLSLRSYFLHITGSKELCTNGKWKALEMESLLESE